MFISKAKRLHWPIKDPAQAPEEKKQDAFKTAREEIRSKIQDFAKETFTDGGGHLSLPEGER